jgi:hypothetical protein
MTWLTVLVASAGCYLLAARPVRTAALAGAAAGAPHGRVAAGRAARRAGGGADLATGQRAVDARLAGVAAAVVALLLRAPSVVIVVAAATAASRALGLAPLR